MGLIDDLRARRETILADLSAMTKLTVGGKPNAMTADGGTSVDHQSWRLSLYKELQEINRLIKEESEIEAAIDGDDGAFEIITDIVT